MVIVKKWSLRGAWKKNECMNIMICLSGQLKRLFDKKVASRSSLRFFYIWKKKKKTGHSKCPEKQCIDNYGARTLELWANC